MVFTITYHLESHKAITSYHRIHLLRMDDMQLNLPYLVKTYILIKKKVIALRNSK